MLAGNTERLSLPEFAKKLGLDIDAAAETVVEVGGKHNLIDIAELAISFGIPTGILYDKDSGEFRNKKDEETQYNERLEPFRQNRRQCPRVATPIMKHVPDKRPGTARIKLSCSGIPNSSMARVKRGAAG
jgi:predicted ATP-dependent endonuclease of OLD family